jgi:DnaK suppressor protein
MALTPSQVEQYRRVLVARRDEFAFGVARAEAEAVEQDELSRFDYGDRATANTAKEDLLQEAGRDTEGLRQIEAAIGRIGEGTFGVCGECGREIPMSRLDAVPWALLCVRDQEIADRKRGIAGSTPGGSKQGGAPSRVVL